MPSPGAAGPAHALRIRTTPIGMVAPTLPGTDHDPQLFAPLEPLPRSLAAAGRHRGDQRALRKTFRLVGLARGGERAQHKKEFQRQVWVYRHRRLALAGYVHAKIAGVD